MSRPFTIRQNDRRRPLTVQLLNPDGSACDTTTADRVAFTMTTKGNKFAKVDDLDMTVINTSEGRWKYEWADGDTDTAGEFLGWVTVYWDAADETDKETFPNGEEEFIEIYITWGNDD